MTKSREGGRSFWRGRDGGWASMPTIKKGGGRRALIAATNCGPYPGGGSHCGRTGVGPAGHHLRAPQRPQSSSASRRTAGAFGFLLLIQSEDRPER
jgi:hypothetical protein